MVVAGNPGLSFGEVGKALGLAWAKVSDADKAAYNSGRSLPGAVARALYAAHAATSGGSSSAADAAMAPLQPASGNKRPAEAAPAAKPDAKRANTIPSGVEVVDLLSDSD